ncbi:hypothetical protein M501DRAFT_1014683 [Patellaria atrata CBS 101060]|uniref:AHC1-like C2H2 zinc-finger domain-containing protein n=1 Tax=Patellaria atrata CBS 101060 TaxID=1346257 RepID=A0A9P4SDP7_9PEZI|nr:hypothetical protein M501DRAFT_1014683 [Patellaria atrata CBS 101060]
MPIQTLFSLWQPADAAGDKMMEKAAYVKSRQMPVVEIPYIQTFKRKRTETLERDVSPEVHFTKKWKLQSSIAPPVESVIHLSHASQAAVSDDLAGTHMDNMEIIQDKPASPTHVDATVKQTEAAPDDGTSSLSATPHQPIASIDINNITSKLFAMDRELTEREMLEETISQQFDQEILLRHEELRLIELELAKCQIALEQIRRCTLIPYPGSTCPSVDVSNGVGLSLPPQPGYSEPLDPAPWGVTDGPYTRHYAKWLIPDARFDSVQLPDGSSMPYSPYEGRSTRGHGTETSRQRASCVSRQQPVQEPPRDRNNFDNLILRRKSDGHWVRLYCHHCQKPDFCNVQGFLNHYRIKHQTRFQSHNEAAENCGIELADDEVPASVIARELAGPQPSESKRKTANAFPGSSTGTPAKPPKAPRLQIMSQQPLKGVSPSSTISPSTPVSQVATPVVPEPRVTIAPKKTVPPTPSASVPHLCSLLSRAQFQGDLNQLISTSRQKVDLTAVTPIEYEEGETPTLQIQQQEFPLSTPTNQQLSRMPMNKRPESSKGMKGSSARLPNSSSAGPSRHVPPQLGNSRRNGGRDDRMIPESPNMELSPHTVESNPGLVSDHDDDEDDYEGSEAPTHPADDAGEFEIEGDEGTYGFGDMEGLRGAESSRCGSK